MAKVPSYVQVGPLRYSVAVSGEALKEFRLATTDPHAMAGIHHGELKIVIEEGLSPWKAADSLFHEVLHAVSAVYDLRDRTFDEHCVEVISAALLDTLQRNPDLVAYLTEQDDASRS